MVCAKASGRGFCGNLRGLAYEVPRSQWRKRYKGWGALAKLQYVDRMARKLGNADIRRRGHTDITVDEMEATVGDFFRLTLRDEIPVHELAQDTDLGDIFNAFPQPGARACGLPRRCCVSIAS